MTKKSAVRQASPAYKLHDSMLYAIFNDHANKL